MKIRTNIIEDQDQIISKRLIFIKNLRREIINMNSTKIINTKGTPTEIIITEANHLRNTKDQVL